MPPGPGGRQCRLLALFGRANRAEQCRLSTYNFVRIHKTLRTTPAMAANVTKRLWEIGDIVDVLEAWEANNAKKIVS